MKKGKTLRNHFSPEDFTKLQVWNFYESQKSENSIWVKVCQRKPTFNNFLTNVSNLVKKCTPLISLLSSKEFITLMGNFRESECVGSIRLGLCKIKSEISDLCNWVTVSDLSLFSLTKVFSSRPYTNQSHWLSVPMEVPEKSLVPEDFTKLQVWEILLLIPRKRFGPICVKTICNNKIWFCFILCLN